MTRRRIGQTDLWVSPVALGCWPIAGITSIGVTDAYSLAMIGAALDAGINFFDTAYLSRRVADSPAKARNRVG